MNQPIIQLESNNSSAKLGCYVLMLMSVMTCYFILINADLAQENGQAWGWILVIGLAGIPLPRYYLSILKRYRVTLTNEEFMVG